MSMRKNYIQGLSTYIEKKINNLNGLTIRSFLLLSAIFYDFALLYNIYNKIYIRHSVISVINDGSDGKTGINLLRMRTRVELSKHE